MTMALLKPSVGALKQTATAVRQTYQLCPHSGPIFFKETPSGAF
jgi:hypothetical protein